MYPYNIPRELVSFLDMEFVRFRAPKPSEKSFDIIGAFVMKYVVKNHYYPFHPDDAHRRYKYPGLTEPEKHHILGPLEYELKVNKHDPITFNQLHLAAWAALLFCWSQGARDHLEWVRKLEKEEERYAKKAAY